MAGLLGSYTSSHLSYIVLTRAFHSRKSFDSTLSKALNHLGPIVPKGARLTLSCLVASHFAMPFPRELTLLLAVLTLSEIVVIKAGKGAEHRNKQLFSVV